jgi:hypothetical protein
MKTQKLLICRWKVLCTLYNIFMCFLYNIIQDNYFLSGVLVIRNDLNFVFLFQIWTTFIYMKKYLRGEIRIYNCASYTFHPTLNFNLRIIYIVFLATLFWWWFLTVTCRILNLCVMAVFKKFSILVTLGLWDLSTCCYVIYFHCASLRLNPV